MILMIFKKGPLSVFLCALVLYASNFNYLFLSAFFPGEENQFIHTGISPEFFAGSIFIYLAFIFYMNEIILQPISRKTLLPLSLILLASFLMTLSVFYHAIYNQLSLKPVITILAIFLYFYIARGITLSYGKYIATHLWKFIALIPIFFIFFFFYFWVSGRIYYLDIFTLMSGSSSIEYLKPQIAGGVRSSEIASFIGLHVIYLLYAFNVTQSKTGKICLAILIGLSSLFLITLFSIGAFLSIFIVMTLLVILSKNFKLTLKFLFAICACILILGLFYTDFANFVIEGLKLKAFEKIYDLGEGGPRHYKYFLLWEKAIQNPMVGIGWARFKDINVSIGSGEPYPHQNFLGIAAEQGLISALFYILFVASVIVLGIRAFVKYRHILNRPNMLSMRYFLFMSVGCFLFLQIHGLFLDTWQFKEIYFWAGATVGSIEWLSNHDSNIKPRTS